MTQTILKQSVAYSYIFSQPFAAYIDAYPMLQSQWLAEQETHLVSYGDHSSIVRVIQHKLNDLKYYDETIDGEYGLFTEYALIKFQQDHQIEPDATLSEQTINAIIEAEHKYYLAKLTTIDQPLYFNQQSSQIEALQRALYYLGYYDATFDGIFGPITESALLTAQRAFGLEETPGVTEQLVETIETETKIEPIPKSKLKQVVNQTTKEQVKKSQSASTIENIITAAKSHTGVRYLWGGTSPSGFDCSGFIQFIFQQESISIPRTVQEMWHQSISVNQPAVGDIVFFETYKKGPSHAGIYLGNGQFIHASESRGVVTSALSETYWQTRYLGSRRIYIN